jgi:flagellar biosynthesis protein FliP
MTSVRTLGLLLALLTLWARSAAAQPAVAARSAETTANAPGASGTATDGGASWSKDLDPSRLIENGTKPEKLSSSLEIMLLMTVLSLAPAVLVMTTCFTRIVVVLALLRQAMATNQLPPSQVITGLALFMTFCVMAPTWRAINADAIQPYVSPAPGTAPIDRGVAWDRARTHLRKFMIRQIEHCGNTEDVYMFVEFDRPNAAVQERVKGGTLQWQDVSLVALIPAFVTSELKQAFVMGFYIYLPFLIIDMVVASILMSMGMMMLPPVLISLPFKLLLFVLVDGWRLVVGSLLTSFGAGAVT